MISLLHSPFLDSITVLHRAVSRHLVFPYWAHEHIAPAHTRAALKIYAASFAVTYIINTPKLFAKCLRYLPLRARARHHKFSNWIVRHGVVSPRTTLDEATSRKTKLQQVWNGCQITENSTQCGGHGWVGNALIQIYKKK